MSGNGQDNVPPDVLQAIATRIHVQTYLHNFLTAKHDNIFRRKEAQDRDYAVAFLVPEQTEIVVSLEVGSRPPPKPKLYFFERKDAASELLSTNPYSALAWRHSPKLELMY